ncbi:PadR family transcriptional regulator [Nocardia sp. NEAU-G5]|uniref:PadR family transcriptional regulator n=1 Tax=Nocardia albiluteola TaxID=2842303 RepID=A0ABS6BF56_9NOCA|nr:PadR family transcriptional regulator [Nocardia albiluteola]MBU3067814.1 PadR family transcriptional regulator [Nocardia albiluteola]
MQLDYVILGALALGRYSGYDLRRWMEGPGRYIGYGVQLPQIYRRLGKLVERGWVEFEVDPREGRPDAKIYSLTTAGRQALLDWARSPFEPSTRPMDPDFKLRLIFAGQLDREIAIDIVRTELEYRRKHDNISAATSFPIEYDPQIPELDPLWAREIQTLAHEQGYASTASYIAWLELTLARLESGRAH